jgi:signal peptidase II
MRAIGWVVIVAALDQLTKWIAASNLAPLAPVSVIDGTLRLTLAHNPGGAFSLFHGDGELITYLSGALSLALIIWLLWGGQKRSMLFQVGMALVAGGAWGNLIDRLRWGYVVDFLDLGTNSWRWPTFNLADSAIVLGTALIALALIVREARSA